MTSTSRQGVATAMCGLLVVGLAACAKVEPSAVPGQAATSSKPTSNATSVPTSAVPATTAPTSAAPSSVPPKATPSKTPSATPSDTASASPSATPSLPAALMKQGSQGKQVRELQCRLAQLKLLSGSVDGMYGSVTGKAVSAFQRDQQLTASGQVDQATWDALVKATRQPTNNELYNLTPAGPALYKRGSQGSQVREIQARLKQLGLFSGDVADNFGPVTQAAVTSFQRHYGFEATGAVDQATLTALEAKTHEPTKAELTNAPPTGTIAKLDKRCWTGRVVCISKTTRQLNWVVDGTVLKTMDVRFGSPQLPTSEGVFSIYWKSRDHWSTKYDAPMPFALFFNGGQAVHYSEAFARQGYNGYSHGCVNVRDYDGVKWLFDQTHVGDKVVVYR